VKIAKIESIIQKYQLDNLDSVDSILESFDNLTLKASECVSIGIYFLWKNSLVPKGSDLRRIWYLVIKLILQRASKGNKNPDKAFYDYVNAFIIDNNMEYKDINIINSAVHFERNYSKGFGNTLLCLEKKTDFSLFENLSRLLGFNVYTWGGQPSFSGTEYVFHNLPKKENLNILTIVDWDSAGIDIANSFNEQFGYYTNKYGVK
jgi:hypothetical protein